MQQFETIHSLSTNYESKAQANNLFDSSQSIISDFTEKIAHELGLLKQLEFYCICDTKNSQLIYSKISNFNQLYPSKYSEDHFESNYSKFKTSKHYMQLIVYACLETQLFNERISWLLSLLDQVYDSESIVVGQARKIRRKYRSNRRSSYIGVSKNGPNWQAMISSSKMKSYIGTYVNELEAAEMFDLYSLLVNGFSAKTNFSYTKTGIINLINKHQQSSK